MRFDIFRGRRCRAILCLALAVLWPPAALAEACAGDCDGNQVVEVDELIAGVNGALGGRGTRRSCPHFDANGDGAVAVDELIVAVAAAMGGCPEAAIVRGVCARPGPSGLEPCPARTAVRAVQCSNPRVCIEEEPGAAALLASGSVGPNGEFALTLDRRRIGSAPIVFDAEVEPGARYAAIVLADDSSTPERLDLDPMSAATTRLIDERGIENFDAAGIRGIENAVRMANAGETFAGAAARTAADRATQVARGDAAVAAAIEAAIVPADVTLRVASAVAAASGQGEVSVSLTVAGRAVVATENLVAYDPSAPIAAGPDGGPDCEVNPSIRKNGTIFSFQPPGCSAGVDCTAVKAFVVALDDVRPIPDGSVLYRCNVEISADLLAGDVLPLLCSTARYSGPDGPIPAPSAGCTNGEVAVVAP